MSNSSVAALAKALLILGLGACPIIAYPGTGPALTGLSARANDASTAFSNAAGLTRLPDNQIVLEPTFVFTNGKFEVSQATNDGGNGATQNTFLLVPSFSWSRPVAKDLWFGLTLNVPSGVGNDYGKSWAGRYLATESTLAFVALTPVLAYKVNDHLSIGGGPTLMYTDSETKLAVKNPALYPFGDGQMKVDENGTSLGWTASVLWEFNDRMRAGLTYRSETDPDLSGSPTFKNLSPLVNQVLADSGALGRELDVRMRTPQIAVAGYYQEFGQKWAFSVDGVWVDMTRFGLRNFKIGDEKASPDTGDDYEDIYLGSIGLFYNWREDTTLTAGMMYASSGKNNKTRTFQMPLDAVWAIGFGMEKTISERHSFHFNLNYNAIGNGKTDEEVTLQDRTVDRVQGRFSNRYAVALQLGFTTTFN